MSDGLRVDGSTLVWEGRFGFDALNYYGRVTVDAAGSLHADARHPGDTEWRKVRTERMLARLLAVFSKAAAARVLQDAKGEEGPKPRG